jgi:hypothetical protein
VEDRIVPTRLRLRNSRGAALIIALAAVVILMMIVATLARIGIAERRQTIAEARRLQADWLAESGLARASVKLAGSDSYNGETWAPTAEDLGGRDGGRVVIVVAPVAKHPGRRLIHVRADYPDDPARRARRTLQAIIELKTARAASEVAR